MKVNILTYEQLKKVANVWDRIKFDIPDFLKEDLIATIQIESDKIFLCSNDIYLDWADCKNKLWFKFSWFINEKNLDELENITLITAE